MLWELAGRTVDSITKFELYLIKLMLKLYMPNVKVIISIATEC